MYLLQNKVNNMKDIVLKKGSTFFLRAVVIVLGLIVLALCIFALPQMWGGVAETDPPQIVVLSLRLIIAGLYASAIPFFIALFQTIKLLGLIDKNIAFSEMSVSVLNKIKYCAIVISALYLSGVPLLFPFAELDDAPGLLVIGFAIACMPVVIAVFAAVLQRLLQNAIDIKSENELTV